MKLNVTIQIWQKGDWFIARCPELDFVSQGRSREEARNNLLEVIQIQFEEMREMGTLEDYLAECGYAQVDNAFVPRSEMVAFEKYAMQVA